MSEFSRVSYYSNVLLCTIYGGYFILSLTCLHYQTQQRPRTTVYKIMMALNVVMLIFNTVFFVVMIIWTDFALSGYPGDLGLLCVIKDWMNVLNVLMADGILLYRLYSIYERPAFGVVIAIPGILFLAVIGTSIPLLKENILLGGLGGRNKYGPAFWCLSVGLNILVTCLITARLLPRQNDNHYFINGRNGGWHRLVTVSFVENAALYSIVGIVYAVFVLTGNPLEFPFCILFNATASIAPNLIMLRIAMGKSSSAPWRNSDDIPDLVVSRANMVGISLEKDASQPSMREGVKIDDSPRSSNKASLV